MLTPRFTVGVAFMRGNPRLWGDLVVMNATQGPFVHSEFFIQKEGGYRFYTSANLVHDDERCRAGGFMPSLRLKGFPSPSEWDTVCFPVTEKVYLSTYAWILQILALNLPYNERDLWQCCVQCLLPFERDLDSNDPATWQPRGVFCSQVCLLLVRRLLHTDSLVTSPVTRQLLLATNSRGCSPNALHGLLTRRQ